MIFNDSKFNHNWNIKELNQLGEFKRGKSKHRPRNDIALFAGGKYPLIQTGEIKEANLYIRKHTEMYNDFGLKQSKLWNEGTLCITIAANIAETALLGYPMCFPDSVVGFTAYPKESSELFMHYVFEYIKEKIQNSVSGSIQDNINIDYLTGLTFRIPEKSYQDKIAAVLSALDAKIELNARINAELESMAKTLYDYWFVQKSNVGKLKVGKLGDFIEVNARSITKEYPHNEIEYIDIASVSTGRLEGTTKYELKDAPSRARRLVKHGDTIWSTVRPNRKSYLFICNPKENVVASTGFAVLTPKKIPPSFLYFFTTTEQFVNYLVSNAEGSAYPAVSADRFAEIDFTIPPESKLIEFENIVSPMLTKISENEKESQTLTELRDWLLPMLMNGQVTIQT